VSARHAMTSDSLIRALPDLVICVRRDGVVLALNGGDAVGELRPAAQSIGENVSAIWPQTLADLVKQLTRKAIATRSTTEARVEEGGSHFDVRATAQGPDRAICVIRPAADAQMESVETTGERLAPHIDRRGFLRRFKQSASMAALRETPLAVAIVHIEGITDIAQAIAPKVSEQIMTAAILRLEATARERDGSQPSWYLGQLSDALLAVVIESADHETIEAHIEQICASLSEPVALAGDLYHLTPSAGIALLGQDTSSTRGLLDRARAAVNEARRDGGGRIRFFTDTLGLKSLARLDIARELHGAIASGEIRLRYVGRHDLESGGLVACVGYLRWQHPLRGHVRPMDFLRIAETTGLGATLSRAAMKWLQDDYPLLWGKWGPEVRISFGALRHHLTHEEFIGDFERLLAEGVIPPERLELRMPASHLGVRPAGDFRPLTTAGVRLVVDEVGRGPLAIDWLARAAVHGLQLDRALVLEARHNPVALKLCKANVAIANALGLTPICSGVDDAEQRRIMLEIGCRQGAGDLYPPA
jgi:predicted signal transduction protein with EAL and GGDEF domain